MTDLPPAGNLPIRGLHRSMPSRSDEPVQEACSFGDLLAALLSCGSSEDSGEAPAPKPENPFAHMPEPGGDAAAAATSITTYPEEGPAPMEEVRPRSEIAPGADLERELRRRGTDTKPLTGLAGPFARELGEILREMAKVFNEFGLFQGPAELLWRTGASGGKPVEAAGRRPGSTSQDGGSAAPVPLAPTSPEQTSALHPDSLLSLRTDRGHGTHPSRGLPKSASRAAAASVLQRPTAAALLRSVSEGSVADPGVEPVQLEEAHASQSARIEDGLKNGQSTDARVILEVAEHGLRLAARTSRLSEEEKARLRNEIASLLARHGFGAAEIRLNGDDGKDSKPSQGGLS